MDYLSINNNGVKSLRIGIDIDGVINDLERFHLDYGTRYCFENNLSVTPDPISGENLAGCIVGIASLITFGK